MRAHCRYSRQPMRSLAAKRKKKKKRNMTLWKCRHRLGEGQTKGGRANTRKSKRMEGGGGGGYVSSESTSCPDPKMERLKERHPSACFTPSPAPPHLPHTFTHTHTHSHTQTHIRETQTSLLQYPTKEEKLGSRKIYPQWSLKRKEAVVHRDREARDILSSSCT